MRQIAGGTFFMGSDRFHPEEKPERQVYVDPFWIDQAPVINAKFARLVAAIEQVTIAETPADPADRPGLLPKMAHAASLVFRPSDAPTRLGEQLQWWGYVPGADWRHPLGPASDLSSLHDHPLVHIAYSDAEAFSAWAGKRLPTKVEWECVARGGHDRANYAWGDELASAGAMLANYWQGQFRSGRTTCWMDGIEHHPSAPIPRTHLAYSALSAKFGSGRATDKAYRKLVERHRPMRAVCPPIREAAVNITATIRRRRTSGSVARS